MERYLSRSPLAGWMDAAGLTLLRLALCEGWFFLLWGVGMPAILAGLALFLLTGTAVRLWKGRTVHLRETALRARIGGELVMEELEVCETKKAHFRVALVVSESWPVTLTRVTEDGVLCRHDRRDGPPETLLVRCIPLPAGEETGPSELLAARRAMRRHGADRVVCCLTGRLNAAARRYAEDAGEKLRVLPREEMIALAGKAWPATDAQLVALGRRRKKRFPLRAVLDRVLSREKARRYLLYGAGLAGLYLFTRLMWYLVPALVCLLLGALCRCLPKGRPDL